jgi:hypothetical protein
VSDSDEGPPFFNTWCVASMLAELLANFETETDLIIIDRGLVDSLVWLIMQKNRGELTPDETARFENFVLLDRWTSLIDLALVVYVDPEEAPWTRARQSNCNGRRQHRRSRGFGLSGKLVEWTDLRNRAAEYNFEPWSLEMIAECKAPTGTAEV